MPSNVAPANPTVVMPYGLTLAFTEELRLESLVNVYTDGRSERNALALNPRRFYRNRRPLTPAQFTALRAFYFANPGKPFYFYALRETIPPWTWDASGASPSGRYIVVFDGAWSENVLLGRSDCSFGLREVA